MPKQNKRHFRFYLEKNLRLCAKKRKKLENANILVKIQGLNSSWFMVNIILFINFYKLSCWKNGILIFYSFSLDPKVVWWTWNQKHKHRLEIMQIETRKILKVSRMSVENWHFRNSSYVTSVKLVKLKEHLLSKTTTFGLNNERFN